MDHYDGDDGNKNVDKRILRSLEDEVTDVNNGSRRLIYIFPNYDIRVGDSEMLSERHIAVASVKGKIDTYDV
ncbi:Hypothetical predicted protein [Octopus vulgaris]|uniref:Uncharacterized protein n=1 Tax=Octopus vulgaris TaxID=6645 RepID=A0AA36AQ84_OCTVU|nr:Hypothetical predicted protein [Octopus vulgaris]